MIAGANTGGTIDLTLSALYTEVELSLSEHLGTKVSVSDNKGKGVGELTIEFYNPAELFMLANKIEKLWNTTLVDPETVEESEKFLEGMKEND